LNRGIAMNCALSIDGKIVPISNFIAAIKKAKSNLTVRYSRTIKKWYSGTGADIIREYHEIINDNINLRGKLIVRELKNYTQYVHAKMLLNGNFVIRENDLPLKLRKRFERRIFSD
jgi:hypothetical protein